MQTILKRYEINPRNIRISFVLTVMGWEYLDHGKLFCCFCGRKVNIDSEAKTTNIDSQPYPTENSQGQLFDPFEAHRYFCLWVHEQKGWDVYVQALWDRLGESEELFRRQNPEEMKKIRVHLDKYLESFSAKTSEQF